MDYRPLGRTGVQVSKLCLGTMMFGAWGNADHDDSIRIIHRALDAGVNFVDTPTSTPPVSPKRSSARRSKAAATTSFWPRRCPCRWTRTRTIAATRAAGSSGRSRTRCGGWGPTGSRGIRRRSPGAATSPTTSTPPRPRPTAERAVHPRRAHPGTPTPLPDDLGSARAARPRDHSSPATDQGDRTQREIARRGAEVDRARAGSEDPALLVAGPRRQLARRDVEGQARRAVRRELNARELREPPHRLLNLRRQRV
jgi:hypothetical protein